VITQVSRKNKASADHSNSYWYVGRRGQLALWKLRLQAARESVHMGDKKCQICSKGHAIKEREKENNGEKVFAVGGGAG